MSFYDADSATALIAGPEQSFPHWLPIARNWKSGRQLGGVNGTGFIPMISFNRFQMIGTIKQGWKRGDPPADITLLEKIDFVTEKRRDF